eukprot:SRR837773.21423.p3 GENE.SRR837773.21423~~SRR837773.21423.p3  ORF type:complete len:200 (-),score=50.39 SRR837773.21423:193-792(-)
MPRWSRTPRKVTYARYCACDVPCIAPRDYCKTLCGSEGLGFYTGRGGCYTRCLVRFDAVQATLDSYDANGICASGGAESEGETASLLQVRAHEVSRTASRSTSALAKECREPASYCAELCEDALGYKKCSRNSKSSRKCKQLCEKNFAQVQALFESYSWHGVCGDPQDLEDEVEADHEQVDDEDEVGLMQLSSRLSVEL